MQIVASIRHNGCSAPIYVAQCSRIPWGTSEAIRLAQRELPNERERIFAGPDIDNVTARDEGGHFSSAGLQQAAELWYQVLCADTTRG